MPKVSVIIPTYNNAQYICEAIDSVLNQSFKDFEIIVIDDGSTDSTNNVIKKYGSRIRYIYKNNNGSSAARNVGIKKSRGNYIAFLDSDDIMLPYSLKMQIQAFLADKSVGLVYGRIEETDCLGNSLAIRINPYRYKSGFVFKDLLLDYFIQTSAVMIRRDCFDKIGYFDEKMRLSEDWDLWLRISKEYKVAHIGNILAKYRMHGKNSVKDIDGLFKNNLTALRKNFKYTTSKSLIKLAVFNVIYEYAWQLYYAKRLKESAKMLFDAFRMCPEKLIVKHAYNRWAYNFLPRFNRDIDNLGKNLTSIDKHIAEFLDKLFKAVNKDKRIIKYKNKAQAQFCAEIGILYYCTGDTNNAKSHLLKAFFYNPTVIFNREAILTLLKSICGSSFINLCKNLKHKKVVTSIP